MLFLILAVYFTLFLGQVLSHDLDTLKERVKRVFYHGYDNYLKYAYPLDELCPLSCSGRDTWGSFSLTLIDSLDTLVIMDNFTEFRRAAHSLLNNLDSEKNVNASVFETNIRVIGGLISAHLLSQRAGFEVEHSWPCSGPLLRQAEIFANKILPAFNTPTGMPYGTVNFALGDVPRNETTITCVAGIGTYILEFGTLSRLTGDPRYEAAAMRALKALWKYRSSIGLLGNHINIATGTWTATDATIGSGVDSYFEYLVKGAALFRIPELDSMFREYKRAFEKYIRYGDWNPMVNKDKGTLTMPLFQSLESFWPGVLAVTGDIDLARRHLVTSFQIWKQYGFLPELYNIVDKEPVANRAAYPLRPELIESIYHLYRATGDPALIDMGVHILTSIETSAKAPCGFATVSNVNTHVLEDRMESFFLAETTKYLYLLFDEDNFIHQSPGQSTPTNRLPTGLQCNPNAGGYVFNTEAHPIDPGALGCCYAPRLDLFDEVDYVAHVFGSENGRTEMPFPDNDPEPMSFSQLDVGNLVADKKNEFLQIIDQTFVDSLQPMTQVDQVLIQSMLNQSMSHCWNDRSIDKSLLDTWFELRQLVVQSMNDGNTGDDEVELDDGLTNSESCLAKKRDVPLLSCPYPLFHHRYTVGGEIVDDD